MATSGPTAFGRKQEESDIRPNSPPSGTQKAIITPSLGHEGIDVDAARSRRIAFANGRVPENFESVAEATILFMLTSLYRIRDAEDRLRHDETRNRPPRARMLKGKTVGIIGYGNIAKALIERLQGWETNILLTNRLSIGAQKGPPIGVEEGPPYRI